MSDPMAECAEVCTSGCHSDDCEHHGHLADPTREARAVIERELLASFRAVEHEIDFLAGTPPIVRADKFEAWLRRTIASLADSGQPGEPGSDAPVLGASVQDAVAVATDGPAVASQDERHVTLASSDVPGKLLGPAASGEVASDGCPSVDHAHDANTIALDVKRLAALEGAPHE